MKNKTITTIVIFFLIFVFLIFYKGLNNSNIYKPSNNENKIIPKFSAYSFFENKLINSENIFNQKKFYLLNIWASWCVPCRDEHPLIMSLKGNDKLEIIEFVPSKLESLSLIKYNLYNFLNVFKNNKKFL